MVGDRAKPCFMEEIHVAIENIAAEWRVGEHVIDRCGRQMRKTVGRRERVFYVLLWLRASSGACCKEDFVRTHGGFDFPAKQLKDVPFVVDRRNVIGLILGIQRSLGAPLIAARGARQNGREGKPQLLSKPASPTLLMAARVQEGRWHFAGRRSPPFVS